MGAGLAASLRETFLDWVLGVVERAIARNGINALAIARIRKMPELQIAPRPITLEALEILATVSDSPAKFLVAHAADTIQPMDVVIKEAIEQAIVFCHGSKEEAARRLKINIRTLDLKLASYERRHRDDTARTRQARGNRN